MDSPDSETEETTTTTGKSGTETDFDSDSDSETGSESGSETEQDNKPAKPTKTTKTKAPQTKFVYVPPEHFKLVTASSTDDRSNPFSDRNLAGKELWFITAPVAAPLSKLTVVNLADIAAGVPTLQTGSGKQYCMRSNNVEEEEAEGIELALHDGRSGYRIGRIVPRPLVGVGVELIWTASKKIVRSFQVVEALPTPATAAVTANSQPKPVRAQPDGLWMRFKPIGYVGAQNEDANVKAAEVEVEVEVRGHGDGGDEHRKKRRRGDGERGEKKKHRSKEKHESRNPAG